MLKWFDNPPNWNNESADGGSCVGWIFSDGVAQGSSYSDMVDNPYDTPIGISRVV